MKMKMKMKIQHPNAKVPTYATDGSACFDLHAATVGGSTHLGMHAETSVPLTCGTGIAVEVPEGLTMLIFSRSGHGFKHGLRLSNCVGVIDSDYRGEILVQLAQDDRIDSLGYDLCSTFVKPGDRIAQAMLVQVPRVEFEVVEQLSLSERGIGGFGSTGGVPAGKLWAIHIPGPNDDHAAPSESMAKAMVAKHNAAMLEYVSKNKLDWGPEMITAKVVEWPWSAEEHAGEVAEFDYAAWGFGNGGVSA